MGYAVVIYPAITLLGMIGGCVQIMKQLEENGTMVIPKEFTFDFAQLNNFLGLEKYKNLEQKYSDGNTKL